MLKGGWRAKVRITKKTKACREIQGDPGRRPKKKGGKETQMPKDVL